MSANKKKLFICTFYHYHKIKKSQLMKLGEQFLQQGKALDLRGLILLSHEGVNATLTGYQNSLNQYLKTMESFLGFSIEGKWQECHFWSFKQLRLKIKSEIVQSGKAQLTLPSHKTYIPPEQWEEALNQEENDVTVIDIRNDYEFEVGHFKDAFHLNLSQFKQFPDQLKKQKFPKDKKNTDLLHRRGAL